MIPGPDPKLLEKIKKILKYSEELHFSRNLGLRPGGKF